MSEEELVSIGVAARRAKTAFGRFDHLYTYDIETYLEEGREIPKVNLSALEMQMELVEHYFKVVRGELSEIQK